MGTSSAVSTTDLSYVFDEKFDCWVVGCEAWSHSEVRGMFLLAEGCEATACVGCPLATRNFQNNQTDKISLMF